MNGRLLTALLFAAACLAPVAATGAPATILRLERHLRVHADGRLDERVRRELRCDTVAGIDRWSQERIRYDSEHQELVVLVATTTNPEGRSFDLPPHGLATTAPAAATGDPRFRGEREVVVRFIGLEPGSRITLEYEIRDLAPWRSPVADVHFFAQDAPVEEGLLTVTAATQRPVQCALSASPGAVQEEAPVHAEGGATYRWRVGSLAAAAGAEGPWVACTEASDWDSLAVCGEFPSLSEAEEARLAMLLPAPTSGLGPADVLRHASGAMAGAFRTVAVAPLAAGHGISSPSAALRNGGGTPLELAWLVAHRLSALGVETELRLVGRAGTAEGDRLAMPPAPSLVEAVCVVLPGSGPFDPHFCPGAGGLVPGMAPGGRGVVTVGSGGCAAGLFPGGTEGAETVRTERWHFTRAGTRLGFRLAIDWAGPATPWYDGCRRLSEETVQRLERLYPDAKLAPVEVVEEGPHHVLVVATGTLGAGAVRLGGAGPLFGVEDAGTGVRVVVELEVEAPVRAFFPGGGASVVRDCPGACWAVGLFPVPAKDSGNAGESE